jgi:glycosyltransferase involved in cell wall biosynthesis
MTTKKIAFVRMKPFPIPNRIMANVLRDAFPEYELDVIDVIQDLKSRPDALGSNLLTMLWEYGPSLLSGQMSRSEAFYATRFLFSYVRKLMRQRLRDEQYAFTFQIQSLFDASVPGTPNFVYTDHSHLARLYYPGFDRRKLRPKRWIDLERQIYQHASLNFTRSSNIACSLVEQYHVPKEKVECVGAGSNAVTGVVRDPSAYANKNILFVGMDWERKGGPDLVAAFEQVLKTHPDARLTIVGCSPDIDLPNTTVAGRVPVDEIHRYYQEASVFCLPTHMEPFGVVFVEALHHRLPVVATHVGAIPDFVEPDINGFLVEPGDVDGLARYLNILLADPGLCQDFGEQSYQLAVSEYSWDRVGEKISASIRRVLAE